MQRRLPGTITYESVIDELCGLPTEGYDSRGIPITDVKPHRFLISDAHLLTREVKHLLYLLQRRSYRAYMAWQRGMGRRVEVPTGPHSVNSQWVPRVQVLDHAGNPLASVSSVEA